VTARPTLQGPRVLLRPLVPGDLPALEAIRAEPGVLEWWGEIQPGDFEHPESGVIFTIELAGKVAGLIQYDEIPEPQYHSAGIDLFLGAHWQGRGLGREAIALVVDHLIDARGHHRLTIDPAVANERAIRCYESVGFKPVGVMREYERGLDGSWHDGLLMELLSSERAGRRARA
jgi:aminoglycoside 6'-N-acetyltransferase